MVDDNDEAIDHLDAPRTVPFQMEPDDRIRGLLVVGLLLLIAVAMIGRYEVANSLIALFSGVTGYYFGELRARSR